MEDLLIFPYSGTAIEALDCLGGQWNCVGFISDDENVVGKEFFEVKVYSRQALNDFPGAKVLAVHGSPSSFLKRQNILESLEVSHDRLATVIHPNASVSKRAKVGKNVLIMAGVVITSNATVGNHIVILPNTVIHHDSTVGDLTLIGANATIAGNVTVGKNCYIGAASSIKNGISLGENVLVGIGANVISNFSNGQKIIGNPAKPLI